MADGVFTPYSTVSPFFGALPSWVPPDEQERVASYDIYEQIYFNHPETFKLVLRGSEARPIYIPSGRTIVETANRYVGKNLQFVPDPVLGSPNDRQAALEAFTALFRRERFLSKYNANKRFGLIRGDWVFHITGDPNKEAGKRLSIHAVNPSLFFTVPDPNNSERIIKVHLIEQWIDPKDQKPYMKRQTYMRNENGTIQSTLTLWEQDKWFIEDYVPTQVSPGPITVYNDVTLPVEITSFPVYHIPNFDSPGFPYGSSEMRGLERVMQAINQAMTDEDLALALDGLGLYTTSGGGPTNDDGEATDWILGPGRVVENVEDFKRVNGIHTLQPSLDHINALARFLKEASATPDAAIGKVDVQVAESGIAMVMQLGPILDKAEEKDQVILDVLGQMFYDLGTMWFPVYESLRFGEAVMLPVLGDKLPKNRKMIIEEVIALMSAEPPLLSADSGRRILKAQIGVDFAENEAELIATQAAGAADAFAQRAQQELGNGGAEG
jgi:Phage portal protein, SPP1 Gp6-like.